MLWTFYQLPARDRSLDQRNLYTGSPHTLCLCHFVTQMKEVETWLLYLSVHSSEKKKVPVVGIEPRVQQKLVQLVRE